MNIIMYPDKRLETKCEDVYEFDNDLHDKSNQMISLMSSNRALGLAAPQVGWMKRVFTMNSRNDVPGMSKNIVFCNPNLIHRSGFQYSSEGCLSFPGLFLRITSRFAEICISYYDISGRKKTYFSKNNIEASVIQHEMDHLDGILFISRAIDLDKNSESLSRKLGELRSIRVI